MDKKCYLLGIDGGGTKTELVLADENCNVIRRIKTDACNPFDSGLKIAKKILKTAILTTCNGFSFSDIVMFAGLSGGTSGNMKQELKSFFEEFKFCSFENDSDNKNIVAAGLGNDDGIIMIMGTGICAISRKRGLLKRYCGWGNLFDDGGCAYNIGRDALVAHFRYIDGMGEYTLFSDVILQNNTNMQMFLNTLYEGGKKVIASYAPIVFECAHKGDEVSLKIIEKNIAYAANVIDCALKDFDKKVKVVVAGGLTSNDMAMNCLKNFVKNRDKCEIEVLNVPPVNGAVLLAKKLSEKEEI